MILPICIKNPRCVICKSEASKVAARITKYNWIQRKLKLHQEQHELEYAYAKAERTHDKIKAVNVAIEQQIKTISRTCDSYRELMSAREKDQKR